MYNKRWIAIALIGLLAACKTDGEVLATYDGGEVTRGEMRYMFTLEYGPQQYHQATTERQNEIISNLAALRLQAMTAREAGIDKENRVTALAASLDKQARILTFHYRLKSDPESHVFHMVNLQAAILFQKMNDDGNVAADRMSEAQELLTRLNADDLSDQEIEEIIEEKSDNKQQARVGGYIQPICADCSGMEQLKFLTDAVQDTDGKFVIASSPGIVYVVRKLDEEEADMDDLRDMYESYFAKTTRVAMRNRDEITPSDERDAEFQQLIMKQDEIESVAGQIADKTVEMEFSGMFQNRVRRLFEDKEVEFHETLQGGIPDESSLTPETPLYTINGETYTYADLNNEIQDADFPLGDKFMMLSTLLTYRVLEDQEDFNSISTDADDYQFFRQLREDQLLASLYLQKNIPEVRVTEEQIRERAESAMRFNQMSFAQVRDQVKAQLENEQRQAKLNEMKQAMAEKYHLQIHADKLEAHEL